MKKTIKLLALLSCLACTLAVTGCSEKGDNARPATAEEAKKFGGGGKMTPEEAAAAKRLMAPPAPAPGQPAK